MTVLAVADSPSVAWITVIGTLGGAAVTGAVVLLTAWLTQRLQGQRAEQEHRFQVERELRTAREESYARYSDAVKKVYVQCVKIAENCRGLGLGRREEMDLDQAIVKLVQLTDRRTAIWEKVLLRGHPETTEAARAWHDAVWQAELFARAVRTDAEAWQPLLDRIDSLRAAFHNAAREDIGNMSGDIPRAGPWADRWHEKPDAGQLAPPPGPELLAAGEPVQSEASQPG
jgi:hypothetical protein